MDKIFGFNNSNVVINEVQEQNLCSITYDVISPKYNFIIYKILYYILPVFVKVFVFQKSNL